jgi:hypothetical protein
MIMRVIVSVAISFILTVSLYPQRSDLQLDVDYAQFRGAEDSLYIELYYSFAANGLNYTQFDELFVGTMELDVSIFGLSNLSETVKERKFRMNYTVGDTTGNSLNQTVIGLSAIFLPAGEYRLKVSGYNTDTPEIIDSLSFDLRLTGIPRNISP